MRTIPFIVCAYIITICVLTVIRIKLKQKQEQEETDYKIMLNKLQNMEDE